MSVLVNPYPASSSNSDAYGDEPTWRTEKRPQGRFADIPILADTTENAQSDNDAVGEATQDTDLQREQAALNARRRADRSPADDSYAGMAAVGLDRPTGSSVPARRDSGKSEFTPERLSKTPREEVLAVESSAAGQKKQAPILYKDGKNVQSAQTVAGVVRKNGGLGPLLEVPSADKGGLPDAKHASDQPSGKTLSRKQSSVLEASLKSQGRLRGSSVESQPQVGSRGGSSPASQNTAVALLSRDGESQLGSLKGGTSVPTAPGAYLVGPTASAGTHASVGFTAGLGADGGASAGVSQSVGEQILDSLKASMAQGDGQVLIRLQPPELGTVLVRFREQGEHLDGTLQVDRTDTRHEIERALPEVVRSLQDAGIGIRRLEVTHDDSLGQDPGGGQPPQDGSSGHRDAGQDREHLSASWTPWTPAAADSSADPQPAPAVQGTREVPRGRIDLLL